MAAHLRGRARYWRERASRETDPRRQTEFRERAAALEHEADALEAEPAANRHGTLARANRCPAHHIGIAATLNLSDTDRTELAHLLRQAMDADRFPLSSHVLSRVYCGGCCDVMRESGEKHVIRRRATNSGAGLRDLGTRRPAARTAS